MLFAKCTVGMGYSPHISAQLEPGQGLSLCGKSTRIGKTAKQVEDVESVKNLCKTCLRSARIMLAAREEVE